MKKMDEKTMLEELFKATYRAERARLRLTKDDAGYDMHRAYAMGRYEALADLILTFECANEYEAYYKATLEAEATI